MFFTKFSHLCISRKYFRIFAKFSYFACSLHLFSRKKCEISRNATEIFFAFFRETFRSLQNPSGNSPDTKKNFSIILKRIVWGDKVFFQLNTLWGKWYFMLLFVYNIAVWKNCTGLLTHPNMLRDIECWDFNDTLNN